MSELAGALVAALGELHDPAKAGRADTGTYAYSYLTLAQLLAAIRPVFASHGLGVVQWPETTDRGVQVTTRLYHANGEELTPPPLELRAGPGAQDVGSAITYARRYALAALCGLAGDEDDDGARAQRSKPPERFTVTTAKRAVLDALAGDRTLAADLWTALDPGRGPFTPDQAAAYTRAAGQLMDGVAHLEATMDGMRLIVHEVP